MKTKNKIIASLALSAFCGAAIAVGGGFLNTAIADTTNVTIEMKNGASIRTTEPVGIRFETSFKGLTAETASKYSFGTLVLPTDMLGDNALTHETADVVDIVKKNYADDTLSTDTEKVMYAVITDIPETAAGYGRELAARSYYKVDGVYTYSDVTVKRSVAQVAANLLSQGYADTQDGLYAKYVNAVAESVEVSASTVEMVVGGQYTLTATTAPANYGVVWESKTPAVATVENGVVKAVSVGTAEIVAKLGDKEAICTVTVKNYIQKDGGDFTYTTASPTAERYAATTETVGGRTGVYKYVGETSSDDWTNKLKLSGAGHLGSDQGPARIAALKEFKNNGYNYATFDIYMAKGSRLRISAMETETSYVSDLLTAGGSYGAANAETGENANVQVYNLGSASEVANIAADTWYTVVIDYSNISLDNYDGSIYTYIEIGGARGTFYLDNVRYYANDTWKNDIKTFGQYDGSEFVLACSALSEGSSYEKVADGTEIYGRTGVYKFVAKTSTWSDKIGLKPANHIGAKFVGTTPGAAIKNMQAQKYAYVTFDVLCVSGGIAISSPEYTVADGVYTWKEQTYRNSWATENAAKKSTNIVIFKADDSTRTDLTAGFDIKTWYTVVVKYDVDANYSGSGYHGIDIASIHGSTEFYFDNVRYYSSNPFGA